MLEQASESELPGHEAAGCYKPEPQREQIWNTCFKAPSGAQAKKQTLFIARSKQCL